MTANKLKFIKACFVGFAFTHFIILMGVYSYQHSSFSFGNEHIAYIAIYWMSFYFFTTFLLNKTMFMSGYISEPIEKNKHNRIFMFVVSIFFMILSSYKMLLAVLASNAGVG